MPPSGTELTLETMTAEQRVPLALTFGSIAFDSESSAWIRLFFQFV
jgi:hypothetical protein